MSQKNKTNTEAQKPKKNKNTKEIVRAEKNSYTGEIIICILAVPTIFTLVSLISYYSAKASGRKVIQENFFTGSLGYDCAHFLNNLFGIVSFYIPLGIIVFVTIFLLKKKLWKHLLLNFVNFVMLLPFLSMIFDTFSSSKANYAGHFLYQKFFEIYIGRTGFILLFIGWAILFMILTFHVSFFKLCAKTGLLLKEFLTGSMQDTNEENAENEEDPDKPEEKKDENDDQNYVSINSGISMEEIEKTIEPENKEEEPHRIEIKGMDKFDDIPEEGPEEEPEEKPEKIPAKIPEKTEEAKEPENIEEIPKNEEVSEEPRQQIEVVTSELNQTVATTSVLRKLKDYHLPDVSLLVPGEDLETSEKREQEVSNTGLIIEKKLLEHKIKVKVHGATIGPVVTMYEIELGEGVKVSQVEGMAKDLTVAVSGKEVRVVGFIPGKPYIGIEIPNEERLTIRLKSILESPVFKTASTKGLPIALGLDVAGKPCAANLNKMPHVLVAGTTGSGKSVGINSFIISLLYTLTPDEVKFIMIDPKGNEFNMYEGIPHMLLPVVVDSKKAAKALQWAVVEMDNRFKTLAENKVKDIGEYNQKINEINKNLAAEESHLKKMPFIVVVIDEFADLMMVAGKEVEIAVARIAQKARAVGIHLIIATQKPTRDVVTGLIKSNLPVRIAFKVASAMDSRVILDTNGADALLGNGDMLYIAPGTSIPMRIHGAFVSTPEMEAVIDFIKQEAGGDYHPEDILESFQSDGGKNGGSSGDSSGSSNDDEPLYDEILAYIMHTGECSASMLQRKFKLGYNRAARIVDRFEEEGIVTPADGSKPRKVIYPKKD
ncbi:DNA translocase FtsK 4TM domain-containing protein [bacterium]|nr:DNA translocase FtsK 4TM domain-containing protein [bacterium]